MSMSLRHKLYSLCGASLVIALSFYGAKHATYHIKAYAQITATPFVAETDFYEFRSNPQGNLFLKQVVARRSDGSTAQVTSRGPIWSASMRKVTFMNGSTVAAFDFVSARTSFQMKPQELAALKEKLTNSPVDCAYRNDEQIIDRQRLFGQEFIVHQHFISFNQEQQRVSEWLAPQLGCEHLGYRIEAKQPDGSYKLVTESRLISLEMKEPEPAFFDPAANFDEVLPSEIMRRHYRKVGQPEPNEIEQQGLKDDQYHKDHPVVH
jgi:hypothetical protein